MGIPNLNKYLKKKCKDAITKYQLCDLENKTIVIDSSIYLYKFAGQNKLIENFYAMISLLLYHKIIPIFVFDGKPPMEKKELLYQRREEKYKAETKYNELQRLITEDKLSKQEKQEINDEMNKLKTQFIRIKNTDIQTLKQLLFHYGIDYYESLGEADVLCAQLVNQGYAWGCMTEDTDLFVYGCKNVIRYISILQKCVVVYNIDTALQELNMNLKTFQQIMILSGTDYNKCQKNKNLYTTLEHYTNYLQSDLAIDFYAYLVQYTTYVENMEQFQNIFNLFQLKDRLEYTSFHKNTFQNDRFIQFMNRYNFVFI